MGSNPTLTARRYNKFIMMDEQTPTEKLYYSWEAKEYTRTEHSLSWYAGAIAIAALVVAYAIYIRQWFLIGVVVMVGVVLYILNKVAPHTTKYEVSDAGIRVNDRFHKYDQFKSFWITDRPDERTASFVPVRRFGLSLVLQLGSADKDKIRNIVSVHLPEDTNREDTYIDKIGRFLKV